MKSNAEFEATKQVRPAASRRPRNLGVSVPLILWYVFEALESEVKDTFQFQRTKITA
jgi:hypothetical protein